MENDKLQQLTIEHFLMLEALFQEGRVGAVAEKMNKMQPDVSKMLSKLRKITGDKLFVKSYDGMKPTEHALRLRPLIFEIVEKSREFLSPVEGESYTPRNETFVIAFTEYAELRILPLLTSMLAAEQNRVNVERVQEQWDANSGERHSIMHRLDTGQIDLLINHTFENSQKYACEEIHRSKWICLERAPRRSRRSETSTAKNAEKDEGRINLKDFLEKRHSDTDPVELRNFLSREKIKSRNLVTRTASHFATAQTVRQSRNMGLFPQGLMGILPSKGLVVKTPKFDVPPLQVYQTWSIARENSPSVIWLRDLIARQCKEYLTE